MTVTRTWFVGSSTVQQRTEDEQRHDDADQHPDPRQHAGDEAEAEPGDGCEDDADQHHEVDPVHARVMRVSCAGSQPVEQAGVRQEASVGDHPMVRTYRLALDVPAPVQHLDRLGQVERTGRRARRATA